MNIDPRLFLVIGWGAMNAGVAFQAASLFVNVPDSKSVIVPISYSHIPAFADDRVMPDLVLPKPDKKLIQTLERPLFVPTRRPAPPPPPPPPPPKPTMSKGQFQLMGVISLGKDGYAFLRDVAGGKVRRMQVGQSVNGIRLSDLGPNSVTLTQYEDTEVLTLKVLPSTPGRTVGSNTSVVAQGNVHDPRRKMPSQRRPERSDTTLAEPPAERQVSVQPETAPSSAPSGGGAPPTTRFGP
jgi:hypothetical protein